MEQPSYVYLSNFKPIYQEIGKLTRLLSQEKCYEGYSPHIFCVRKSWVPRRVLDVPPVSSSVVVVKVLKNPHGAWRCTAETSLGESRAEQGRGGKRGKSLKNIFFAIFWYTKIMNQNPKDL